MYWQAGRFQIDLNAPKVMGIVNVTPDSFSDGGSHDNVRDALAHCEALVKEGADILDIGGESTRPGSPAVPLEEELARVIPVVRAARDLGVPLSIDTYKPEVMRAALGEGADIINDIWALRQSGAREAVAAHPDCGICIMHMHRDPQTMQQQTMDGDVVDEVWRFLAQELAVLRGMDIARERIVLDAGIGFGKTVEQNFALLSAQNDLVQRSGGYAWLAGWSRKSSLGAVTGLPVDQRLGASVAAALLSVQQGAAVVRVHDVRDTVAALKVFAAMEQQQEQRRPARR
ncbi:dihydropteroate synthase [Diaphorobacter caeni]|uniref:dihydropteroate synthase n=1 Tax=Diaphorobacter caeni TaxID=2784387 RepID=UPI00188FEBEF|nr:dihydropteroate synthase [Diaphorobacter caeni]MBF5005787.1 dihydropteroate synthase [Diaphorobacter caeni]